MRRGDLCVQPDAPDQGRRELRREHRQHGRDVRAGERGKGIVATRRRVHARAGQQQLKVGTVALTQSEAAAAAAIGKRVPTDTECSCRHGAHAHKRQTQTPHSQRRQAGNTVTLSETREHARARSHELECDDNTHRNVPRSKHGAVHAIVPVKCTSASTSAKKTFNNRAATPTDCPPQRDCCVGPRAR